MKAHLMHPREDFDPYASEPQFAEDIVTDLELDRLCEAMAAGDGFLREVARAALLHPLTDPDDIAFRQQALADASAHPDVITALFTIASEALHARRGFFMLPVKNHPGMELSQGVKLLRALGDQLDRLRTLASSARSGFRSPAFKEFFDRVALELDDAYMKRLRGTLRELSFPGGMLMSAGVGPGGTVTGQVLRRAKPENRRLFDRTPLARPHFSFTLPERDEAGANALSEFADRSVNAIAAEVTTATDHVMGFFTDLRAEVGFYLAAGNLARALEEAGVPICTPAVDTTQATVTVGLCDPCLALTTGTAPVGNSVVLDTAPLLVITGANLGGKSTFLRALGTAQLMAQAGLPVAAESFTAHPVGQVLTHWAREEDAGLVHGKLDEELTRMERIVDVIQPGDLLLCNESFASTNEVEGSQILLEVTRALTDSGIAVLSVTHLFDFADTVAADPDIKAVFLRAPRARSFHLEPGPPLATSFGLDLFDREFGTDYADD